MLLKIKQGRVIAGDHRTKKLLLRWKKGRRNFCLPINICESHNIFSESAQLFCHFALIFCCFFVAADWAFGENKKSLWPVPRGSSISLLSVQRSHLSGLARSSKRVRSQQKPPFWYLFIWRHTIYLVRWPSWVAIQSGCIPKQKLCWNVRVAEKMCFLWFLISSRRKNCSQGTHEMWLC